MSFLDEFEDVFIEPENAPIVADPANDADSPAISQDYFDREDEPVLW